MENINPTMGRPELEALIRQSKIPSFFSFIPYKERQSLITGHLIYKDYVILSLNLLPNELETIRRDFTVWKKVLETFLFIFNHTSPVSFSNITFSPVIKGDKKINSCITMFNGITPSGKMGKGYRELASFCLNITNHQKNKIESENKPIEPKYNSDDERIYFEIKKMLEEKNISVRKIFALGMKQWQSRIIYSKIMELGLFEIDKVNQNEKIYCVENFEKLTIGIITEILSMENPQN